MVGGVAAKDVSLIHCDGDWLLLFFLKNGSKIYSDMMQLLDIAVLWLCSAVWTQTKWTRTNERKVKLFKLRIFGLNFTCKNWENSFYQVYHLISCYVYMCSFVSFRFTLEMSWYRFFGSQSDPLFVKSNAVGTDPIPIPNIAFFTNKRMWNTDLNGS